MKQLTRWSSHACAVRVLVLALALVASAGLCRPARAQSGFPRIPTWSFPGGFCSTCGADSIVARPRSVTLRFLRSRVAEARTDFGGYRIYRVTNSPDTSRMVLIRRFSTFAPDSVTWHFSKVDPVDLQFKKRGVVVHDSVITFVDPDSAANYTKVCRFVDNLGRCTSRGDSVLVITVPPGPHDGFPTYYSVTYEARNNPNEASFEDLYVGGRDTLDNYVRCTTIGDPNSCPYLPNANHKALNVTPTSGQPLVEPTAGPFSTLESAHVVPNPFRGDEVWDQPGSNEVHFVNLPTKATIKIFTVAGDLVQELTHDDPVRDFERWNLKNGKGNDVASGIYLFRIESGSYSFQDRFVVIR